MPSLGQTETILQEINELPVAGASKNLAFPEEFKKSPLEYIKNPSDMDPEERKYKEFKKLG